MKKKHKILKRLQRKGFLKDKNTVKNYEQKLKEQDNQLKNIKDKVSLEIKNKFGSFDEFTNFLKIF